MADALERLERVAFGGIARFVEALSLPTSPQGRVALLSELEKSILRSVAAGQTSKEIAAELGRSSQTVDVHIRTICRKLGSAVAAARPFSPRLRIIDERRTGGSQSEGAAFHVTTQSRVVRGLRRSHTLVGAARFSRTRQLGKDPVHQTTRIATRTDVLLAAALTSQTQQIAARALAALAPAHRTVAAEIVVMRFVERFAVAAASANWALLLVFIEASCQRYAGILPMPALMSVALDATCSEIDAVPNAGVARGGLSELRAEMDRLTSRPRLVHDPRHEAIDQIDVALDDLITRLDQSDQLTAEHSRAVSAWCGRLAERLSLSRQETIEISRSGLVHDIGKITTPTEILNAPRSLTEAEFAIMRRHAADGAAIIVTLPLVAHLIPAVRSHHERMDGRGYPDGLAGKHIPSTARIVCVADAFNAMIGRRPYRAALPPSVASTGSWKAAARNSMRPWSTRWSRSSPALHSTELSRSQREAQHQPRHRRDLRPVRMQRRRQRHEPGRGPRRRPPASGSAPAAVFARAPRSVHG